MQHLLNAINTEEIKLDLKDKKIISLLAEDARMPLTQLCKKVALSRDAVSYRIKNYEKQGLIQGYITRIDISKFGYESHHIFIKLNNPSKEVEEKIVEKMSKLSFVRSIIKFGGDFDLELALIAKNIKELDSHLEKINFICHGLIEDLDVLPATKPIISRPLPKSFMDSNLERPREQPEKYFPDKKDIDILKIISTNSRENLSNISYKTNLSADAVSYRIKKMTKTGIITKFSPMINFASLGYSFCALIINIKDLDKEKEEKAIKYIKEDKNCLWAIKTLGRFNFLIYLLIKNTKEMQTTMTKIRSLFPGKINRFKSLLAYEQFKYTYFPADLF